MNKRRKFQLKLRKWVKNYNKGLYEDKWAGRFEIKLTGRKDFSQPTWPSVHRPQCYTTEEIQDPEWHWSLYTIELIDNEEPERNCSFQFRWSETFGFCDGHPLDEEACKYYHSFGLFKLGDAVNEFIIQSDFDKKWKYLEYAKTHWFSGEELNECLRMLGPNWTDAETLLKSKPDRFKLGPVPKRFEEEY